MENILFSLLTLFTYAQDLRFTPLEQYAITQSFPFGYSINNNEYKEYAKNKSKVKDKIFISSIFFTKIKAKNIYEYVGLKYKVNV